MTPRPRGAALVRRACVAVAVATLVTANASIALAQDRPTAASRVLTKAPKLVEAAPARYPEGEAAAETVTVALTLTLTIEGRVASATVARSGGEPFDAAALEAATRLVFEPAEIDGRPAAVKITYEYAFAPPPADEPTAPEDTPDAPSATTPATAPTAPRPTAPNANDAPEEVRVSATRAPKNPVGTVVSVEEARRVPGTQGDALKVVANLPGMARASFGSGQLVVWGSAPRDTRVYVDGVEIPALYHGSGLRGTVNADLVRSIELVPGAYGADYGRGLGGLVRMETRALPDAGLSGYVAADLLDASAMVAAAPARGVRVAVGARQSYLDQVLKGVVDADVGDFFSIPRYRDYQTKAVFDLRKNEEISLVFLGSADDLARTLPSRDPQAVRTERTRATFHRLYARYTRTLDDGTTVSLTPFVGYDTSRLDQAFGPVPAELSLRSLRYGVRAAERMRVGPHVTVSIGLDALGSLTDVRHRGSLNRPAREGDVSVFGQPPGDDIAADDDRAHVLEVAPYVTADVKWGPLTVTPGLRANALLVEGARVYPAIGATPAIGHSQLEGAFDPRLAVRLEASKRLTLTAGGGIYHQAPEPEDLSSVFGTPELTYSRARHAAVGGAVRITATTTLEATGFYKSLDALPFRSRLPAPRLSRALIPDGEGRSVGAQILLRQAAWRGFFGWVSYTASRSERRYYGDVAYRKFDYDQPHVLTLVASQELGSWTFGARFRFASGAPRTPVTGSYYDPRGDRYQPIFGAQSSERLPAFAQLDLRVEKAFTWGRTRLSLYADVQNVTSRTNAEEYLYAYDYRSRGVVTGLPTIAIVGARVELK